MDHDSAGLCARCKHAKRLRSARGSMFLLCLEAERDPKLSKYPRLPTLHCEAHAPEGAAPLEGQ